MPTVALHSHFWAGSGDAAPPVDPPQSGASVDGGYVPWQTTVILGGGFGVTQVAWEWLVERVKERRDGDV
jgi:hypothetical protein